MTNIEYLQSLGKEKAVEFLDGFCPKHKTDKCYECPHEYDPDFCNAYTSGVDALGHWLFEEHKEEKEKSK